MASGVDLGTGWINVVASFGGLAKSVSDGLGDLSGVGAEAGDKVGSSLGDGVKGRLSSVTSSIGSAFAGAFDVVSKSAAAAGAAAATGLAAAVKGSISAYGEYEQLVGGVETLFKDNAGTVQKYASEAYKTAGMSANQYMETITGFSASLLQGLGGDTAKAAEIGNRAVIDMSDNANKMGTDMGRITDAYQGFAKQNYTMLDNLKLGYGGTKEEMARLISDASKLTDVQAELGVTVDESSMSFDNIVNAISVVQKNMDITGTTALEAAGTLQGSMEMMKASWTDLLTAFGSGENVDVAFANFTTSVESYLGNLVPVARRAAGNIVEALRSELERRFPVLAGPFKQVEGMFQGLADAFTGSGVTSLFAGLAPVVGGVAAAIAGPLLTSIPMIGPAFASITGPVGVVLGVFAALLGSSETLRGALGGLASGVLGALGSAFQTLGPVFESITAALGRIAHVIGDAIGNAVNKVTPVISDVIDLLAGALADVLPSLVPVIAQIGAVVASLFPVIADIAAQVLPALAEVVAGLLPVIPMVADAIMQVLGAIAPVVPVLGELITALLPPLAALIQGLVPIVMNIVKTVISSLVPVINSVIDVLRGVITFITGVFTGDWSRAWEGVNQVFSNVWGAFTGIVSGQWRLVNAAVTAGWEEGKLVFSVAGDLIRQIFGGVWDSIVGIAQGAWSRIVGALAALSGLGAKAGEWFGRFKDGAVDKFNEAVNWVRGVPSRVLGALGNVGNLLRNAGVNIINGFINGIMSAFGRVRQTLNNLTSMLPDWKGPAPVDRVILREPARLIMGGFADELADYGYGATRKALGGLTDALPGMVETGRLTLPVNASVGATGRLPGNLGGGSGGGIVFNIGSINNPVAEPSSTALNRELQRVGAGTALI